MDVLGLPDRAGAAQPGQRLGVRPAHRRRQERLRADPRHPRRPARPGRRRPGVTTTLAAQAAARADRGGLRPGRAPVRADRRPALLRPGLRGAGPGRRRRARPGRRWPPRSTPSTARPTATTSPATPASRSSGSTCGSPASGRSPRPEIKRHRSRRPAAFVAACLDRRAAGLLRRTPRVRRDPAASSAPSSHPARSSSVPPIVEEFGSTVPVHPASRPAWTSTST